jgi:two-component system LytT family sensor kinase
MIVPVKHNAMHTTGGRSRRTVLFALLIWAAATLLQAAVLAAQERLYIPFALAGAAIYYGLLGILAIPVWKICDSLRERSYGLSQVVGIQLLMGLAVLTIWGAAYLGILYLCTGGKPDLRLRETGLWQILGSITTYAVMVAGIIAVQTSRRLQMQMRRESELQILARDAEIRALKLLIRPHFFFNAMNAIYSLIETRPREAREMVDLLAQLMRQTLEAAEENLVSLDCELETVKTYLRIEKVRLGDRLTVRMEPNGVAPDWAVPPFLLQPVVENAIKHGIAPKPGPGAVDVFIRTLADQLEFTVRDTGPGCRQPPVEDERESHGLSIIRRRLENLYGKNFSIVQRNLDPSGFEVSIRIPRQKLESIVAVDHA